jgi:glycosyltransferase involved in cell wall biosynthesis
LRTLVAEYGVAEERVRVAPPGVDRKPFASPSAEPPVRLLSVGSLIPRKGFGILIDALATLADLQWSASIVGGGEARTADTLRAHAARSGIAQRVSFAGALPRAELDAHYRDADVFVLPSLYEGYGMVVGEALAFGLPVVGTDGGALAGTIPDGAGRKARAGDAADLARHLRAVIADPTAIVAMAECARAVAETLPRWPQTAAVFRRVLDDLE